MDFWQVRKTFVRFSLNVDVGLRIRCVWFVEKGENSFLDEQNLLLRYQRFVHWGMEVADTLREMQTSNSNETTIAC